MNKEQKPKKKLVNEDKCIWHISTMWEMQVHKNQFWAEIVYKLKFMVILSYVHIFQIVVVGFLVSSVWMCVRACAKLSK